MKSLGKKYRIYTVWLCLLILAMAFLAASDEGNPWPYVTLAFLAGAIMYSLGAVREWALGRRLPGMAEFLLAVCMWCATAAAALRVGGIL